MNARDDEDRRAGSRAESRQGVEMRHLTHDRYVTHTPN